jgi:hypothetical protein
MVVHFERRKTIEMMIEKKGRIIIYGDPSSTHYSAVDLKMFN